MTRYQLAKIIAMAGTVRTRKRLQKIVYLLQAADCPLEVTDFRLHLYGTYSRDVAELVNEMVQQTLIDELPNSNGVWTEYNYKLEDGVQENMRKFELSESGRSAAEVMDRFQPHLKQLLEAELRELELASTVVFYWKKSNNWDDATKEASNFKNEPPESAQMKQAVALAQRFINPTK